MASRRSDPARPSRPWRPAHLHVWGIYRRERTARARPNDSSNRRRLGTVSYDVRFMVDGHEFRYGFDKKTWADEFANQLHEQFVLGYLFDPVARRFLEPAASSPSPTYVEHAADHFWRNWPDWSPKRRQEVQRELALASLHLLRAEAPVLTVEERLDADRYLRTAVLVLQPPETLSSAQRAWQAWFERWSLPLDEVTDADLHAFLSAVRTQALDGTPRTLAPNTLRRIRAIVGATFVSARKRRLIDWNPWEAVEWDAA